MKIHFDNVDMQSSTGPNSFAQRIAQYFIENNHKVSLNSKDADVSLVFIQPSGNTLSKKVVQRLDGIWFKPDDFYTKNKEIKNLYNNADGVVWQSEFDKKMTTFHWQSPKHGTVIKNGIKISKKEITNPLLIELQSKHEKIFVCSANWHPQKRLNDNISLFKHFKQTLYPTAALIILGNNPKVEVEIPQDVYYAGSLPHEMCLEIFAACNWMIHLAWLDHCPNTVVEALSQKLPIICSSTGGTKELVNGYGLVVNEEEYTFNLVNYEKPPAVNVSLLNKLPAISELNYDIDVSIETCGKKYLEFFKEIL